MLLVTQLSVASGVFRIGVGASLLIFLFVFLLPCMREAKQASQVRDDGSLAYGGRNGNRKTRMDSENI